MAPNAAEKLEEQILTALRSFDDNPDAKVSEVARQYGVPYQRLLARRRGRQSKIGNSNSHMKLSPGQELALCEYVDRLDRLNLSVRRELIRGAANFILQQSTPPGQQPQVVGNHWIARFINRHKYRVARQKTLDSERKQAENLEGITEYYQKLHDIITNEAIQPTDIWNMDETGFCIGVGRDQMVVTRRKRPSYLAVPTNRESATSIEAISAGGDYIPPFLILSGAIHMERWYRINELQEATVIALSASGYSNDQLSVDWIQHFNSHTQHRTTGSKRLLLLDGHGSHHTKQFIQYCVDNSIIPFGLPPHSTHLLQPLDVVVFQPLKHYHAKAVDTLVRDGCLNITKLEFLGMIEGIRKEAFKRNTIQSAFKKTGIYPFDPAPVLQKVEAQLAVLRIPSPALDNNGSSPFATPHTIRKLHRVSNRLLQESEELADQHQELAGRQRSFTARLSRFIKGAEAQGTQLLQTKRDLSRTRLAESVAFSRRQSKNRQLQSGGVLTVAAGREMVVQREDNEMLKAQRAVDRRDLKWQKLRRKWVFEAAKKARRWRLHGTLEPLDYIEQPGCWRRTKRV